MHLEAKTGWTESCTWMLQLRKFGNAIGGHDWLTLEMHLEEEIKWTQRCAWRPYLNEFRDAFGAHDRASLEMQLEAIIEQNWKSPWRWSIGWCNMCWDSIYRLITMQPLACDVYTYMWALMESWLEVVERYGGTTDAEAIFRGEVLYVKMKGDSQSSVDAILGVCYTRCTLYLALTDDQVPET